MNDEDHDGHTINLGPPAGSPADERPKWDPREEDDWYPPHAPVSPPVREGRRLDVTELPEWAALVDAVNDDGGSVAGYRANVTGRASALTRAVRAAAADREDRAK